MLLDAVGGLVAELVIAAQVFERPVVFAVAVAVVESCWYCCFVQQWRIGDPCCLI